MGEILTPSTDSSGTTEGFTPAAFGDPAGPKPGNHEEMPMWSDAIMEKSRDLKEYDAPTLDWIETQEFPVRRLLWIADPIRLSSAVQVEDMDSFKDADHASSTTLHLAEMPL